MRAKNFITRGLIFNLIFKKSKWKFYFLILLSNEINLNFKQSFVNHPLSALAPHEWQQMNTTSLRAVSSPFPCGSSTRVCKAQIPLLQRIGPSVPITPTGPVAVQRLAVAALAIQIVGGRVVSASLWRLNTKLARCKPTRLANKIATPRSPT